MKDYTVINDIPSIVIVNTPAIDVNRLEGEFYKYDYLNAIDKIKKIRFLPLEDLVDDIKDGPGGWDINTSDYVEQGVPMLRTINIVNGLINLDECVFINIEKHEQLRRSRVLKNDVLLSVRGTIGKSAVYSKDFEANINAALVKITLKNNSINPYYLATFFNCKYGRLQTERIANGAVQLNMNLTEVKSNLIPIPSPEIQKYIGEKVRKAEELREEAKRLKKEAEEILYCQLRQEQYLEKQKSIVNKYIWILGSEIDTRIDSEYYKPNYILYKHILNKNGIRTKKIKEIVIEIKTGTTPQNKYITKDEKQVKFLRVNNLGYCILKKDDMLYVNDNYYGKKLKIISKGDILVSIAGTLGRSSVVDMDNCTTNQNIAALTLKNLNLIRPYYLSLYLNSYFGNLALDTISTQATVKYINNELLGEIEVPLIDIDIQLVIENRIVGYKDKINQSKQLIQEAKKDVEDLIEGNFDISKVKSNS